MLSECQTAWIRMRRRVTRRLIRIQAVCIWDYSPARRSKGLVIQGKNLNYFEVEKRSICYNFYDISTYVMFSMLARVW